MIKSYKCDVTTHNSCVIGPNWSDKNNVETVETKGRKNRREAKDECKQCCVKKVNRIVEMFQDDSDSAVIFLGSIIFVLESTPTHEFYALKP